MNKTKEDFKEVIRDKMTHEEFWTWVGDWYNIEEINTAIDSWTEAEMQETIDDYKKGKFSSTISKKTIEFLKLSLPLIKEGNKVLKKMNKLAWYRNGACIKKLREISSLMNKHSKAMNIINLSIELDEVKQELEELKSGQSVDNLGNDKK